MKDSKIENEIRLMIRKGFENCLSELSTLKMSETTTYRRHAMTSLNLYCKVAHRNEMMMVLAQAHDIDIESIIQEEKLKAISKL